MKWTRFFATTRRSFEVMPSLLSQVCLESRSALQGYHHSAPSCDGVSLPAWIDWEQDFISCPQNYAAILQNAEWYGKIQNVTIKVTDVDVFDMGRFQSLRLLEEWLCDIKHLTLLPSPKQEKGGLKSGLDYVWPIEWFILMKIMYKDHKVGFLCQVADLHVPMKKWLRPDNFMTALYSTNYPIENWDLSRILLPNEDAMEKDANIQFCLILTPEMDDEGQLSRSVKVQSDPQPTNQ